MLIFYNIRYYDDILIYINDIEYNKFKGEILSKNSNDSGI
jgi:hypothetical protein